MKRQQCSSGKAQIAREILKYLSDHPSANDTFEGIVQWWLLERKIKYQQTLVAGALDELVRGGYVLQQTGRDNTRNVYRINPDERENIKVMLGKCKSNK